MSTTIYLHFPDDTSTVHTRGSTAYISGLYLTDILPLAGAIRLMQYCDPSLSLDPRPDYPLKIGPDGALWSISPL